jgi:hypothetical protein
MNDHAFSSSYHSNFPLWAFVLMFMVSLLAPFIIGLCIVIWSKIEWWYYEKYKL